MSDPKQKHTRGVPWADHTTPSSAGDANPADQSAQVDPEELGDREEELRHRRMSPGTIATATPASPASPDAAEGGAHAPNADDAGELRGQRDVGDRSLRSEKKPE